MARKITVLERLKALGRLGAYTTFIFVGLAAVALRSARSDAGEASLILGREFANLGGAIQNGQRVRLNGETFYVGSTTVDMPTHEVLDRFEALCRQNSQGLDEVVRDPSLGLPAEKRSWLEQLGPEGLGILRNESHGEGTVACIAHNEGGGFKGLVERLVNFTQDFDLRHLGKLRYVYTRPTSDKRRSQVITVWTDGSVRLSHIFPISGGEAPGADPVNVPRPPEATRLLSAEIDGAPYGIRLYESTRSPAEVLQFYDQKLAAEGWSSAAEVPRAAAEARAYSKDGAELLLLAETGPRTSVSLVELPAKTQ
ncbi:MAG: hypothetical protein RMJ98_05135 [Myxococcales bacterium]|nr:hypothetical protein [Polyangiaceae bacterium]MDW8248673.1 hypothetical protein [Myxococcales bacterium]